MKNIIFISLIIISLVAKSQIPLASEGKLVYHKFENSKFIGKREIAIWLPKNYNTSIKYNVIYMHDAQSLFDTAVSWNHQTWEVDETMQNLIDEKKYQTQLLLEFIMLNGKEEVNFFLKKPFLRYRNNCKIVLAD